MIGIISAAHQNALRAQGRRPSVIAGNQIKPVSPIGWIVELDNGNLAGDPHLQQFIRVPDHPRFRIIPKQGIFRSLGQSIPDVPGDLLGHHENRSAGLKHSIIDDYRDMSFYWLYYLNIRRRPGRLRENRKCNRKNY
ncbi:hypothetical protein AGR8A_Lc10020 [Agrobacterium fabrum str. J-07]|nr:hypothetical protein AGR8A_Lc10020 [Agrobacterium fabrum str. J-07]